MRNSVLKRSGFVVLFSLAVFLIGGSASGRVPEARTVPPVSVRYAELGRSVETALVFERSAMEELRAELARTRKIQALVESELNAYRIQYSTHRSLLLLPGTALESLEKALQGTRDAHGATTRRIDEVAERLSRLGALRDEVEENINLNKEYLSTMGVEVFSGPEDEKLPADIRSILELFSEKSKLLLELLTLVEAEQNDFQRINAELETLGEKLELQIKNRIKEGRFVRGEPIFSKARRQRVMRELTIVAEKLVKAGTADFWISETGSVFRNGRGFGPAFLLILFPVAVILIRLRLFCGKLSRHPVFDELPAAGVALGVFGRSFPLLGIALMVHGAAIFSGLTALPFVRMVLTLLWTFLMTRWARELISVMGGAGSGEPATLNRVGVWSVVAGIRVFCLVYAPVVWLVGGGGAILALLRILAAVGLLTWLLLFSKRVVNSVFEPVVTAFPGLSFLGPAACRLLYVVVAAGPLAEVSGYGAFVMFWYMSWGNTVVALMWWALLFRVLREWGAKREEDETEEPAEDKGGDRFIRWVFVQAGWVGWFASLLFAVLMSWSSRHELITICMRLLKYPLTVGKMTFSLMGCLYAFLTLVLTHLLCRAWRHVLKGRLLQDSGMEPGLQESIVSITGYVVWGAGIFVALHVFGLNTASLALGLGALGIGIGLGLQNIVNNFVSGIILLFERPIQVGDDVEVGGVWATVRKIKVRSTVVQTYDNASLIIPNSEFISNQVTNWSFRDKRLRRKIVVGVAYGSDIELVRKTLLEIADRTPDVRRFPHPDVIFSDFGDSALIFTLRIWTSIEGMLEVETDIRFQIDRLFRERNISIAFPQRDVRLYSMDGTPGGGAS